MKKGARTTLATLMALGIFGYFFWLGTPSGKGFMEHPLTQVVIDRILPFVLILSPLLAAVLTRTVPHEGPLGENQRARIRSLLTKLCLGTAASLAMTYWGVYISEMRPFLGFAILMQMSLLYILAVPLIRAKQLDASTKAMLTGAARTASLVPRNVSSPLPPQAWSIAWKLWGAGLFLVTVGLLWRRRWSPCEDAVFFLCLAGAVQAAAPFFLRWWLQQP
ncbi:MAG: hypothetical protein QG656_1428, partial [Candidatus Hydrogenedentes bacterium]|nr:hypothetical protein [Candidatus Hydrogenedentota bacterium]